MRLTAFAPATLVLATPAVALLALVGCAQPAPPASPAPPSPVSLVPSPASDDFYRQFTTAWVAVDEANMAWAECVVPASRRLARESQDEANEAATAALVACTAQEDRMRALLTPVGDSATMDHYRAHMLELSYAVVVAERARS